MHHLQENDSPAKCIRSASYSQGSLLESDDADLAPPIVTAAGKVKTLQIESLSLDDEDSIIAGALARRLPKLRTVSDEFHKVDVSYLAGPAGKGASPVFSSTVPALFAMKEADFDAALDAIAARAANTAHPLPAPYKDVAKRFSLEYTAYRRVTSRVTANEAKKTANGNAMVAAKDGLITEMHRLEGKLKDRHPNDPAQVEAAFLPEPKGKHGKPAAATPPAPNPPAPPQPPPAPAPQPAPQAQPPVAQQPTPNPQPQPPPSQQPTPHP